MLYSMYGPTLVCCNSYIQWCVLAEKVKFNFDEENSSDEELELKDNEAVINGDGLKQEIDEDLDNESFQ